MYPQKTKYEQELESILFFTLQTDACPCVNGDGYTVCITFTDGPDEVVLTPAATTYTAEEFSAMRPVSCNCGMCKPNCTAQWISNTLDVSFKDQCSLELKTVTTDSAGLYICTCVNPYTYKQESRQFNLTVQCKLFKVIYTVFYRVLALK